MFGRKGKEKDGSASKKPDGRTLKKGESTNDAKSPRVEDEPVAADSGPVDDSVMSFMVGDTRLGLTHKKLLQDQHFYDMELSLGGQHKRTPPSHVHRAIIAVRCPSLLAEGKFISKIDKSKSRWQASINEATLPFMSPTVLSQLLMWVYCGSIEVGRFQLATLLDVCACAVVLELKEVQWTCEHRVREILNIESVHVILKGSEDRSLEGVKNFALEYAFDNWNGFIGNQEGAKILGLELFQDVSAKFANLKGDKMSHPEGPQPPNVIVADYRRLYEEMHNADMQIEVAGTKLNCHRAVLGMYSDGLGNRFKQHLKSHNQAIKLIDVQEPNQELRSPSAVESFLRFVYYGETKMDPIDACEMIHKVNSVYKLNTFQLLCEHTIIRNINSRSVLPILGVTYIRPFDSKPHIQALRKQAFNFVIAHFGTTDLDSLGSMPPEIRTDLLVALQQAFKAGKLGQGGDDEAPVAVEDSE